MRQALSSSTVEDGMSPPNTQGRAQPLPAAFRTLWLVIFINRAGSFVIPFLALYLTVERHMPIAQAGLVIALYGAGAIVAGPTGGMLADRIGRRRAIALGLGLSATSMVHMTFAASLGHLLVATFLLGVCADMSRPGTNAAIADLVSKEQRPRAFAHVYWAANLGFAFASVAAGLIATRHFELLFYLDAASSLAAMGLVLARLPETRPSETESRRVLHPGVALRDRVFLPLFAVSTLVSLVFMQFNSSMPMDLGAHGHGPRTFGILAALNCSMVVLLQPLMVRFAAAVRPLTALVVGSALTGLGFGIFGIAPTLPGFVTGVVVITLGEIAMAPAVPALIAEIAPEHLRGTYQGTFGMSFSIAACLGPLVGSRVLASLGGTTFWLGAMGTALVGAFLYARLRARGSQAAPLDRAPATAVETVAASGA